MGVLVDLIIGARPNIMKIAPIYHALNLEQAFDVRLVHTGQHNTNEMSHNFLRLFGLPDPNFILDLKAGTQAFQTGEIMKFYDEVTRLNLPDLCIVVGDVNSSVACAIVAVKKMIPVFHVEAGLRSNDRTMPEEINRTLIDAISDVFYTPSIDANENLFKEGKSKDSVVFVGNVMIDSFEMLRSHIENSRSWDKYGLTEKAYGVVTFHRPGNVDHPINLAKIVHEIKSVSKKIPLVFPIHPRTKSKLEEYNLMCELDQSDIVICNPLDYVEFMSLVMGSRLVITDSGGVQEETTYLGVTCLTVRENTERPITVLQGTNRLVEIDELSRLVEESILYPNDYHQVPEFWDGKSAIRIVDHIREYFADASRSRLT